MLLMLNALFAYTWSTLGPPDVPIQKADWHVPAVLSNGHIGLYESGTWNYYTYLNLNVVDFTSYDSNKLMVILGSGSNSDGVYFFDLHSHNFQLLRWEMNPVFVKYDVYNATYYVGGLEGLWSTGDGSDWTEISVPGAGSITDIAFYGMHTILSKNNEVWHTADGYSWVQSPYASMIHGFRFDDDGVCYGIINSGTYSDGIWRSLDYGEFWSVIEYTLHLSCVGPRFGNNVTFGWLNGADLETGVGMTVPGGDYILLNDGLNNLNIHYMDTFDLINTPSFWVGTDIGAFYCTGFLTPNDDPVAQQTPIKLKNYPNPFSTSTTFTFNMLRVNNAVKIEIYNIKGEKIVSKDVQRDADMTWNGQNTRGVSVAEGIYICKLVSNGKTLAAKSIVFLK
jgi:hypothetical protein